VRASCLNKNKEEIVHAGNYNNISNARVWGDGDKNILKDILEKENIDVGK